MLAVSIGMKYWKCSNKYCFPQIISTPPIKVYPTQVQEKILLPQNFGEFSNRNHASIFSSFWYHSQIALFCLKQWKHWFLKYVKYVWKPMYKICWKPTIKAQEQGDWCSSGISIINFRGVVLQDLVEHLRWSFFAIQ